VLNHYLGMCITRLQLCMSHVIRTLIPAGALMVGTAHLFSCTQFDHLSQRNSSGLLSQDASGQKIVSIPVNVQELAQASGLNLAGNRITYAKFVICYTLSNDPTMRQVVVGYNVTATPPSQISATISGPLGASINIVRVDLVDLKTNNSSDPSFTGLTDKIVSTSDVSPLTLRDQRDGKAYSFAISRNAISATPITIPPTPINLVYSVRFSLVDCLDSSSVPDADGKGCITSNVGFGQSTGTSTLDTMAVEGVAAPQVEWNGPASRVAQVTNNLSSPPIGKVLIVLDCDGAECPTHLKATNGLGHRPYMTPVAGPIPTTQAESTFKIINGQGADITANALEVFNQNPTARFCVLITLDGVALQRPVEVTQWYNDFRIELERRDGTLVGSSTFSLIGKQAFHPNP